MARFCANCGTEVDDTAVFCPTCGQPIEQADEAGIPPAPAWPDAAPPDDRPVPSAPAEPRAPSQPGWHDTSTGRESMGEVYAEDPTRVEAAPPPVAEPQPRPTSPERPASPPARAQLNVPVTWPVTLSSWLIGAGALVAAVGALIGMFRGVLNPIDLLLLLLLIGIAVTVFFSASVPAISHLRLATLAVALTGFGIALDRIGLGFAGIGEVLLFLGTAAAAMGCILLELGRDQPLGGPRT